MPATLAFKANAHDAIERLRTLYSGAARDRVFAAFDIPSPSVERFAARYPHGYCPPPDPEERVRFWEGHLAGRTRLEDDSLPCAYLSEFDQGLYGGLFGGDVQFMAHPEIGWISSMVAPLLDDWSELDSLQFDGSVPWYRRFVEQTTLFARRAEGRFGVSHFILIDGLNFVFELVGATATYMTLIDRPDEVRRAIDLAFEVNRRIQADFFEIVGLFEGGTFSNMTQWLPGRIVSESVDPFHMTSVDYFEEWGREPVERILAGFDGGVVHIHGNGRHLLEAVSSIRGLRAMMLADDRGFPLAFEVLPELQARTGDLPLVVEAEFPAFEAALGRHGLCGGVLYKVTGAPDLDAANRCMERVREYRL